MFDNFNDHLRFFSDSVQSEGKDDSTLDYNQKYNNSAEKSTKSIQTSEDILNELENTLDQVVKDEPLLPISIENQE